MRPRICISVPMLLLSMLFVASCGKRPDLTEPTTFSSTSSISLGSTSPSAIAQRVNDFACPVISPFSVPIVVVVESDAAAGVVVTQLRMQFVDVSGARMPQVTMPAPLPITQFGSDLAATRAAQAFPVTLGIGCGTGHTGNLLIFVDTRDGLGRVGFGQTTVIVR